jgi:hypothetical protein
VRWQPDRAWAFNRGMGLPHAAMGPALWLGYERAVRIAGDRRGVVACELFLDLLFDVVVGVRARC